MANDESLWAYATIKNARLTDETSDEVVLWVQLPMNVTISDPDLSWVDGITRLLAVEGKGDGKA
jgi:hypothetical protein